MTITQKLRRKIANLFYDLGNLVQYYVETDPTPYDNPRWANVEIGFAVKSSADYDAMSTKVVDAAAELLEGREWTAGSKLDVFWDDE